MFAQTGDCRSSKANLSASRGGMQQLPTTTPRGSPAVWPTGAFAIPGDHLVDKIKRKRADNTEITRENFFLELTDIAGVRILHLFQEQFGPIDAVIRERVRGGDWCLAEPPKAYARDPESVQFSRRFDLDAIEKSTAYTSVHYVVKPLRGTGAHVI
jgi:hypothetical protein